MGIIGKKSKINLKIDGNPSIFMLCNTLGPNISKIAGPQG